MRAHKNVRPDGTGWLASERAHQYEQESNRWFYEAILNQLLAGAPAFAGQGLDLGCGTGFSTECLARTCPRVRWHGVDGSRPMLAVAHKKSGLEGIPLLQADAEFLPFADGTLDVVVTNFAWHWFGKGAGLEVRRVLRPGGWLLASVPLRQFSRASGNRALARALLASRRNFESSLRQGFRLADVRSLLPGDVHIERHSQTVVREEFTSSQTLLDALASRGALQAIFADAPPPRVEVLSPVLFEWPFAILHVRV